MCVRACACVRAYKLSAQLYIGTREKNVFDKFIASVWHPFHKNVLIWNSFTLAYIMLHIHCYMSYRLYAQTHILLFTYTMLLTHLTASVWHHLP